MPEPEENRRQEGREQAVEGLIRAGFGQKADVRAVVEGFRRRLAPAGRRALWRPLLAAAALLLVALALLYAASRPAPQITKEIAEKTEKSEPSRQPTPAPVAPPRTPSEPPPTPKRVEEVPAPRPEAKPPVPEPEAPKKPEPVPPAPETPDPGKNPSPPPVKESRTVVAVAQLESVAGEVYVLAGGAREPAEEKRE